MDLNTSLISSDEIAVNFLILRVTINHCVKLIIFSSWQTGAHERVATSCECILVNYVTGREIAGLGERAHLVHRSII